MSTFVQKLRSGLAKADDYIQEHGLATKLEPIATIGGFLVVLSLVVIGIYVVTVVPHVIIQRSLDAALRADRAKQLELEDTYRKTITQIVLGVFGLFLLYFTWRRSVASDKTVRIAEQGHITDRFTKAIEQLGKTEGTTPNIEVRLGAIYALERIALDSPRDHWTIMEILTAYVRQNAPLDPARPYIEGEKPRTDIQAILTVLGRRRTGPERERSDQSLDLSSSHLDYAELFQPNFQGANFFRTSLRGAWIYKADFRRAVLTQSNLEEATLREARFQGASLTKSSLRKTDIKGANLHKSNLAEASLQEADASDTEMQQTNLYKANLRKAILHKSNLQEAYLCGADLQGADLRKANLHQADLESCDLKNAYLLRTTLNGAINLTTVQVLLADGWEYAHYSPAFRAELGLPPEPEEATD